eukprot:14602734-Alexandrium_andersonii.AAC.1
MCMQVRAHTPTVAVAQMRCGARCAQTNRTQPTRTLPQPFWLKMNRDRRMDAINCEPALPELDDEARQDWQSF